MTDLINKFASFDILSPMLEKPQTSRGVNEWRDLFDKMMMNVFTEDASRNNTEKMSSDSRAPVEHTAMDGMKNIDAEQTPATFTNTTGGAAASSANELTSVSMVSEISVAMQNPENTVQAMVLEPRKEATYLNAKEVEQGSKYLQEFYRKMIKKNAGDRVHMALCDGELKLYVRHRTETLNSTLSMVKELLYSLRHADYAVSELKINGKNVKV